MKTRAVQLRAFVPLSILVAACSPSETATQAEGSEAEIVPPVVPQVIDPTQGREEIPGDLSSSLARLENCAVDEESERRIRELEFQLDELLLSRTERHPRVIATREALESSVQDALSACVEQIQAQ